MQTVCASTLHDYPLISIPAKICSEIGKSFLALVCFASGPDQGFALISYRSMSVVSIQGRIANDQEKNAALPSEAKGVTHYSTYRLHTHTYTCTYSVRSHRKAAAQEKFLWAAARRRAFAPLGEAGLHRVARRRGTLCENTQYCTCRHRARSPQYATTS